MGVFRGGRERPFWNCAKCPPETRSKSWSSFSPSSPLPPWSRRWRPHARCCAAPMDPPRSARCRATWAASRARTTSCARSCSPAARPRPSSSRARRRGCAASLERLDGAEDPQERRRLGEQVARELRARIREMGKYLDPERTLSLGLLAVPDSVYGAAAEAQSDAYREGIVVVPYSLALPYVLAIYRLALRFGGAVDTDRLAARVRALEEGLRKSCEELEGRFSRALVQLGN